MIKFWIFASLIFGGILLTCGDLLMKVWATSDTKIYYVAGVAMWTIASLFIAWTYKYENMAIATIIYIIMNVGTLLAVSWVYYKEALTIKQIIGVVLGLIACFLM